MKEWKVEYDDQTGEPYLRLWQDGKRTTILILRKYLNRDETTVGIATIRQLDIEYHEWLDKPF